MAQNIQINKNKSCKKMLNNDCFLTSLSNTLFNEVHRILVGQNNAYGLSEHYKPLTNASRLQSVFLS
jgi:hypothetical protein